MVTGSWQQSRYSDDRYGMEARNFDI